MRRALRQLPLFPLLAAVAGPALFFACTARPTGIIDAADLPKGGLGVYPDSITCGVGEAGAGEMEDGGCQLGAGNAGCCSGPGVANLGSCIPLSETDAAATCPANSGLVACNETADCLVNATTGDLLPCCATIHGRGDASVGYISATCSASAATCAAPLVQLCRTNGECPGDKCVIQLCPDGQTYEMCGLSTSPDFLCKAVNPSP